VSLLTVQAISKSYAGVRALRDVSFELRAGEVHALVGENGAGKSTLIKIITGATEADSGEIKIDGRVVEANNPARAKALGVAAIYQQPALFPDLSVAENIALGLEGLDGRGGFWQRVDWRARRTRAAELLRHAGARIDPEATTNTLTMPEQQLVEIARALGARARVLIMDEPTASLTAREVESLFQTIGDLRASGVGIIYISHRLDELFAVADRVTVLRDGRVIETRMMADVDRGELIRLMVGRELEAVFPKREVEIGDVLFAARELGCSASGVRDVNFELRAGEILGFAGLVGAGRTELAQTLFGLTPADSGSILLRGAEVEIDSPARAVSHGIAYVPEDRRRHGVILEMPIWKNTTLAVLRELSRNGFLRFAEERALAARLVARLGVKTPSLYVPAGNLSGGNQQKVALSRWLATEPRVLILDEPTQGLDVGAKAEVHRLMVELAAEGMGVIMISSELPEILGMSDRVCVMRGGTVAGTLTRAEATQDKILALALSGQD
jgi:rhamnose transport system ATP-binding protein